MRSLADYQALYPGFEATIANAFSTYVSSGGRRASSSPSIYARVSEQFDAELEPLTGFTDPDEPEGAAFEGGPTHKPLSHPR